MGCRRGWATSELTVGCQSNWSLNLVKPWALYINISFCEKRTFVWYVFQKLDWSFTSFHLPKSTQITTDQVAKKKSRFNWAAAHGARFFWTPQMDRVYIKGLRFGPPELLDHCWMFHVDPWRRHEMRETPKAQMEGVWIFFSRNI